MKITRVESLHADASQRNFDFLKISTDAGIVGWSEYNESFGGIGISTVIDPDTVPWYDDLVTEKPAIRDGYPRSPLGRAGAPRSTRRRCALIPRASGPEAATASLGKHDGRRDPAPIALAEPPPAWQRL